MMRLQLLDQAGNPIAYLDDDSRMLGYYPVDNYMTLHVCLQCDEGDEVQ